MDAHLGALYLERLEQIALAPKPPLHPGFGISGEPSRNAPEAEEPPIEGFLRLTVVAVKAALTNGPKELGKGRYLHFPPISCMNSECSTHLD